MPRRPAVMLEVVFVPGSEVHFTFLLGLTHISVQKEGDADVSEAEDAVSLSVLLIDKSIQF